MFFRLVFFWSGVYMIPSSRIVICFWCYCCLVMIHGFVFIRAEHLLYGRVTDTAYSFCVIEFLLVRSQHSLSLNFSTNTPPASVSLASPRPCHYHNKTSPISVPLNGTSHTY